MTIAPDATRPYVVLALDTRGPALTISAPARVVPPDDIEVEVAADEPLGPVRVVVTDSYGTSRLVGHERTSPTTLCASIPTTVVASGEAVVRVEARDLVCNVAVALRGVLIDRPKAYDVVVEAARPLAVEATRDRAYDTMTSVGPAWVVEVVSGGG